MMNRFRGERELRRLDDKAMLMMQLDSAIKLGRAEGQLHQMQWEAYIQGRGPEPKPYERTSEWRLMRQLERQYRRLLKELNK